MTYRSRGYYKSRCRELEQEVKRLKRELRRASSAPTVMDLRGRIRFLPPSDGGHWLWIGGTGRRPMVGTGKQRTYAYRYVWDRTRTPLEKHARLYNRCGELQCVNPAHYEMRSFVRKTPVVIPVGNDETGERYRIGLVQGGGLRCPTCTRRVGVPGPCWWCVQDAKLRRQEARLQPMRVIEDAVFGLSTVTNPRGG